MPIMTHVSGKNKGDIRLYKLSTCIWCRKVKQLLDELGVEYHFVDVDLLEGEEKEATVAEMTRWNPDRSFPTMVINDQRSIVGFQEEKIREELGG